MSADGYDYSNGGGYYTTGQQQFVTAPAGYGYATGGQQVVTRTVPVGYATNGYAQQGGVVSRSFGGYQQGGVVTSRSFGGSQQGQVMSRAIAVPAAGGLADFGPPIVPDDLPAGAVFSGTMRRNDGTIIDTFKLTERETIPVRSVVPEVQEYQVTGTTTVPETKHIQVEKMVPVIETVMVPKQEVRTVMVPEQRQKMVPKMETQAITVEKVVPTQQTMQRTVNKVIEGSKFVDHDRVLEYERPRPRLIQHATVSKREAGVQFTSQVGYTGEESNVRAVSQPRVFNFGVQQQGVASRGFAVPQQQQYVTGVSPAPMVASVPPTQYVQGGYQTRAFQVQAPTQVVQRGIYESPGGYMGIGAYQASPPRYNSTYQTNQMPPQYSTQPGNGEQWAGYDSEEKEGAF